MPTTLRAGSLPSTIAHFRAPKSCLVGARVAYEEARLNDTIGLLHGDPTFEAAALRYRAHLRLGRTDHVLENLAQIDIGALPTRQAKCEILILRSIAHTWLRYNDEARADLDEARVFAYASSLRGAEAEFHFYDANWFFTENDLARTDELAREALEVVPKDGEAAFYPVPVEHSHARAFHMRGMVAARKGHFNDQLGFIKRAIVEIRAKGGDLWILASLLTNLAVHVRDFDLQREAEYLRDQKVDEWPADLDLMKFQIYRALGWASALQGDHLRAFGEFRKSYNIAPSLACKVWVSTDRAFLAHELGEHLAAREEAEHASDLSRAVDWDRTDGEERFALIRLAQQLAVFSPDRAHHALDRYRSIKAKLSPVLLNTADERVTAHEHLAMALICRHSEQPEIAKHHALRAFETWSKFGCGWLAANAALELTVLGVDGPHVLYAQKEAAARPHSWLARRARAATGLSAPEGVNLA